MKKMLAAILTLCLTATLCACGGPSDEEIQAVRSVSFTGTELTVTLGANRSTGYEWEYAIYGACIEPSANRSFRLTGSKGDATGEVSIGFSGKTEGTAVIVLTTPNGWDGTGEGDGYTVNVVVGADGTIEKANGMDGAFPAVSPAEPAPEITAEPTPEPTPKTAVTIAELAEGTYTGTMSADEYVNSSNTVFTTIMPADITVTVANAQMTVYCKAACSAYGMLGGEQTPQSPEGSVIVSGTLPLEQSGDAVTAAGELPIQGEMLVMNYTDSAFTGWELKTRDGNGTFTCTVRIAMENGVPVATVNVEHTLTGRTATVPLALKGDGIGEPLSAPYAAMLRSGDYQYTYSLVYEGSPYTATVAAYNGMICRKVASDDGAYCQRVITRDGNAWKVDDLTGAVTDGGAENAETLPDYAATLTFVASKTLETGAVADAYDFVYAGQPCNLVFLFTPEGDLTALITTEGGQTSEMEILHFSSVGSDTALFDIPQQP